MAEETETMQPGEAAGRNAEPLSAEPDTQEDVSERISKAVAEAKKEAEAELKKVRRELDSVKKAHMTEDEKKQADLTETERELAQREAELQNERSRMYAVKAIKKAGLDDGGDNALELVDFVLGDDEAQIDARVKAFGALVQKYVDAKVEATFKSAGRIPGKGTEAELEESGIGIRAAKRYAEKIKL